LLTEAAAFVERDKTTDESRGLYRRAPIPLLAADKSVEEIARAYEEMHRNYADEDEEEFAGEETINIKQQSFLPSVRDPKLWMTKCKVGVIIP
jgi:hypothetical protein